VSAAGIPLTVNGKPVTRPNEEASLPLLDVLQEYLGLTGTKLGCGVGQCRACTVAVQDTPGSPWRSVQSCLTPLAAVHGKSITTVEGLASGEVLHPLQQAFLRDFAFQCGYCTPGFLMAAWTLLDELRRAPVTRDRVDDAVMGAIGGNVCRCTGYSRYFAAVKHVVLAQPGLVKPG
jgi:aerobic-type carbon monoxide dehydrogenase small subunit (CoxS/CutS family)